MWGIANWLPRRWARRRRPTLSVVVPVYNVERYLPATLDSLLAQSYDDFEAVVVIDGSTDRSGAVAKEYAARDRRVRVLEQANAGLGAARNVGVTACRGRFLTFLDADDVVPPHAYATMMATLTRTGSDLVAGTLKREAGSRQVAMRLMRENHRTRRESVSLTDVPLMLADVFAVNKIFRRDFWDAEGLTFPEGVRYEDQPTLTRALLASRAFDVIPETVYLWQVREDQSSITQGRQQIEDLRDRILTKQWSTDLVVAQGDPVLTDTWFRDVIPVDMWEYFRSVPGCSDEYWSTLRAGVRALWNPDTVTFDQTRVPVQQRLMGWLVDQDRRADLEELIAFLDDHHGDIPIEVRHDHVVARLPGVGDDAAELPPTVYVLAEHEHRWEGRVTAAQWDGDVLRLEGFAVIVNAPTHAVATTMAGRLLPAGRAEPPVPLEVVPVTEPRATQLVGRPRQGYDACGFRTAIRLDQLLAEGEAGDAAWRLQLVRTVAGMEGSGGLAPGHGLDLGREWHSVGPSARFRLRNLEGELVLERG